MFLQAFRAAGRILSRRIISQSPAAVSRWRPAGTRILQLHVRTCSPFESQWPLLSLCLLVYDEIHVSVVMNMCCSRREILRMLLPLLAVASAPFSGKPLD
jgi:hypothetical protein